MYGLASFLGLLARWSGWLLLLRASRPVVGAHSSTEVPGSPSGSSDDGRTTRSLIGKRHCVVVPLQHCRFYVVSAQALPLSPTLYRHSTTIGFVQPPHHPHHLGLVRGISVGGISVGGISTPTRSAISRTAASKTSVRLHPRSTVRASTRESVSLSSPARRDLTRSTSGRPEVLPDGSPGWSCG